MFLHNIKRSDLIDLAKKYKIPISKHDLKADIIIKIQKFITKNKRFLKKNANKLSEQYGGFDMDCAYQIKDVCVSSWAQSNPELLIQYFENASRSEITTQGERLLVAKYKDKLENLKLEMVAAEMNPMFKSMLVSTTIRTEVNYGVEYMPKEAKIYESIISDLENMKTLVSDFTDTCNKVLIPMSLSETKTRPQWLVYTYPGNITSNIQLLIFPNQRTEFGRKQINNFHETKNHPTTENADISDNVYQISISLLDNIISKQPTHLGKKHIFINVYCATTQLRCRHFILIDNGKVHKIFGPTDYEDSRYRYVDYKIPVRNLISDYAELKDLLDYVTELKDIQLKKQLWKRFEIFEKLTLKALETPTLETLKKYSKKEIFKIEFDKFTYFMTYNKKKEDSIDIADEITNKQKPFHWVMIKYKVIYMEPLQHGYIHIPISIYDIHDIIDEALKFSESVSQQVKNESQKDFFNKFFKTSSLDDVTLNKTIQLKGITINDGLKTTFAHQMLMNIRGRETYIFNQEKKLLYNYNCCGIIPQRIMNDHFNVESYINDYINEYNYVNDIGFEMHY